MNVLKRVRVLPPLLIILLSTPVMVRPALAEDDGQTPPAPIVEVEAFAVASGIASDMAPDMAEKLPADLRAALLEALAGYGIEVREAQTPEPEAAPLPETPLTDETAPDADIPNADIPDDAPYTPDLGHLLLLENAATEEALAPITPQRPVYRLGGTILFLKRDQLRTALAGGTQRGSYTSEVRLAFTLRKAEEEGASHTGNASGAYKAMRANPPDAAVSREFLQKTLHAAARDLAARVAAALDLPRNGTDGAENVTDDRAPYQDSPGKLLKAP